MIKCVMLERAGSDTFVTHGVTFVTHGVTYVTHGVTYVTHGVTYVTHGVTPNMVNGRCFLLFLFVWC
jgi:hypothetical protein